MRTLRLLIVVFGMTMAFSAAVSAQNSLTTLDGSSVDLGAQRGKVVVLAIGAAWLPLSVKQAEYTNALAKKYAGRNVVIFFVATDSSNPRSKNFMSSQDIRKFAMTNKVGVPVLRDSEGAETLRKYNVDQVPSFVILDRNGAIAGESFGGIDPKFDVTVPMSKVIDKLL